MAPCPTLGCLRKHQRLQPSFLKPLLRFGGREPIGFEVEALKFRFAVLDAEDGVNAFGKEVILPVQRVELVRVFHNRGVLAG